MDAAHTSPNTGENDVALAAVHAQLAEMRPKAPDAYPEYAKVPDTRPS